MGGRPESGNLSRQAVKTTLSELIRHGEYPPHTYLPPLVMLADFLGASERTIIRASEDLTAKGMLNPIPGHGTEVLDAIKQHAPIRTEDLPGGTLWESGVRGRGGVPSIKETHTANKKSTNFLALCLEIPPSETVYSIIQLGYADFPEIPSRLMVATRFYFPQSVAKEQVIDNPDWREATSGRASGEHRMFAAVGDEIRQFRVARGTPMIQTIATRYQNDQPIRVENRLFPGNRLKILFGS